LLSPADVSHTANAGRKQFEHRAAVTGRTTEELKNKLKSGDLHKHSSILQQSAEPKLAFLFTGQGSYYPAMGEALRQSHPIYRDAIDRCSDIFARHHKSNKLTDAFLPDSRLQDDPIFSQSAIFAVEYALSELWRSFGVLPNTVIGHSLGEYAAAVSAQALSVEDALKLIITRARLMSQLARGGSMVAIQDSADIVKMLTQQISGLEIAAVNSEKQTVLSGASAACASAIALCQNKGVAAVPLTVTHAFHSRFIDPIVEPFRAAARSANFAQPRGRWISTVTGRQVDRIDPDYWADNLRHTVRFKDAVEQAASEGCNIFLEVGPQPQLIAAARHCHGTDGSLMLSSLQRGGDAWQTIVETTAHLYVNGVAIDWEGFDKPYPRKKISLPTYPFQRKRYWLPSLGKTSSGPAASPNNITGDVQLFEEIWLPAALNIHPEQRTTTNFAPDANASEPGAKWIILSDCQGYGDALAGELQLQGAEAVCVRNKAAQTLAHNTDHSLYIDPTEEALTQLLAEQCNGELAGIIHCWALDFADGSDNYLDRVVELSGSALSAVQHLLQKQSAQPRLFVLTHGALSAPEKPHVNADPNEPPKANVFQSVLSGFCKAAIMERPLLRCRQIDLDGQYSTKQSAAALLLELEVDDDEQIVALRGNSRYVARLRHTKPNVSTDQKNIHFSSEYTYVVTGGMGGIGIELLPWLIQRGAKHVALIGRTTPSPELAQRLEKLRAQGASVEIFKADVSEHEELAIALQRIRDCMPPLKGVFHAAGVHHDGTLEEQDWESFRQVFKAKVNGGWQLHELTRTDQLDHFVLFSSAASLFGSVRQSGYCAANAFLDGLAYFRRASGLPALSINWGVWLETGMATREADKLGIGLAKFSGLSTKAALGALDILMSDRNRVQAGVANLDENSYLRQHCSWLKELRIANRPAAISTNTEHKSSAQRAELNEIQKQVGSVLQTVLRTKDAAELNIHQGFFDMGFDSLMALELSHRLQKQFGSVANITVPIIFNNPSIERLSCYIGEQLGVKATQYPSQTEVTPSDKLNQIAIVGIGCRFPGGLNDPNSLWHALSQGVDAVGPIPADRWSMEKYFDPTPDAQGKIYVREAGTISTPVDSFDSTFFGISPREAEWIDPQQRLLLEVTWEALENAGIAPSRLRGSRTGVFVGACTSEFGQILNKASKQDELTEHYGAGTANSVIAGRVSFTLGLQGPALVIDTSCSSSLVAVHNACNSLLTGESDNAIAAGVSLILSPDVMTFLCKARMVSRDGRSKSFDASADGYGRGEGCGVVILKRLSDAEKGGDNILAVLKATSVNQDGASSGLTVPNGTAQVALIREALRKANLQPSDIDVIEAHGTGTPIGDPIEATALREVFSETTRTTPLIISSVKTNLGHLEAASGIAGLIKTVLCIQNKQIVAHLHFKQLNSMIDLQSIPATIPTSLKPWEQINGRTRRAGVSSFGFSGTNAHAILEEYVDKRNKPHGSERPLHIILLSAQSKQGLEDMKKSYLSRFDANADAINIEDIAHTANCGRNHFSHRLAIIAAETSDMIIRLQQGDYVEGVITPGQRRLGYAFVFSSFNEQDGGIAAKLYESNSFFRQCIDRCLNVGSTLGICEAISYQDTIPKLKDDVQRRLLSFAFQFALSELWQSFGITPDFVIARGDGRLAASLLAGEQDLQSCIRFLANSTDLDDKQFLLWHDGKVATSASDDDLRELLTGGRTAVIQFGRPYEMKSTNTDLCFYQPSDETTVWRQLLDTLARLYLQGAAIDWLAFDSPYHHRRTVLPTYPFQRQKHWPQILQQTRAIPKRRFTHPLLGTPAISED
jgi:acyl transferase domain-containing protein